VKTGTLEKVNEAGFSSFTQQDEILVEVTQKL